jgi:putative restriction endonuclease
MQKALVAVTDRDWFTFLRARRPDEVNFWQPRGGTAFRALERGQPLLFKLHAPENVIVGGGFFTHFSIIPVSLAWKAFGEANGAASFTEMTAHIERLRRNRVESEVDYQIGCIILSDPFFLDERYWIEPPRDFSQNIVRYKGYDLQEEPGASLWARVIEARALSGHAVSDVSESTIYGEPALFRPRLGQGSFRVVVTDEFERHCAVSGEKTLPVLEAAHIRPVASGGTHQAGNGLLLRSDIHTLFDRGYVTVTPDYRFLVSRRLRDDWENGRVYYELAGGEIFVPRDPRWRPDKDFLTWHSDTRYLG